MATEPEVSHRNALVQLAGAMRKRANMEAGYTVLMLAVDEIDCLRAENAALRAAVGRRRLPMLHIAGAP